MRQQTAVRNTDTSSADRMTQEATDRMMNDRQQTAVRNTTDNRHFTDTGRWMRASGRQAGNHRGGEQTADRQQQTGSQKYRHHTLHHPGIGCLANRFTNRNDLSA